MTTDLLGNISSIDDLVVPPPPGVAGWSENFFFHPYDHVQDIGLAMHMGRSAQDPWMWREIVYVYLPDGRVLAAKSFGRRETENGPGAANLSFTCIEPFRRWKVSYNAAARVTSVADLLAAPLADGPSVTLRIDVEVESLTPVWSANTAPPAGTDGNVVFGGAFGGKERFHYEQVTRTTGTISYGDTTIQLDATGFRDHTRGIRKFGGRSGHTLLSCLLPDGFAAGMYQVRSEDGTPQFNQGFSVDGGVLSDAEVIAAPRLDVVGVPGPFTVELATKSRGRVALHGTPLTAFPQTICIPNDIVIGIDRVTPGNFSCVLAPATIELDGQVGGGHLELSLLNTLLPDAP